MLSYSMIPIVQDVNDIGLHINIITNVSSNAYYGYQPQMYLEGKHYGQTNRSVRKDGVCMDIQHKHSNCNTVMNCEAMQTENIPRQVNRKRRWDHCDEFVELKKKRENDKCPLHCPSVHEEHSTSAQKHVYLRKPTHNIPDLPRCIMGHYI